MFPSLCDFDECVIGKFFIFRFAKLNRFFHESIWIRFSCNIIEPAFDRVEQNIYRFR